MLVSLSVNVFVRKIILKGYPTMKKYSLIFLFLISITLSAQTKNVNYDSTLAKSLGADEYGMKNYVLVILKTGPAVIENKTKRDSLFAGHMANISRLAKEGKLIVAGPFNKNDFKWRGLFILNVKTVEEAKELVETDPTVKAKIFDVDLVPWYGSAALSEYLKVDEKIHRMSH